MKFIRWFFEYIGWTCSTCGSLKRNEFRAAQWGEEGTGCYLCCPKCDKV